MNIKAKILSPRNITRNNKDFNNVELNVNEEKYKKFVKILEKTSLPLNNITFNKFLEKYPDYKISKTDFNNFKKSYNLKLNIKSDKYNNFVKILKETLKETKLPLNKITFNNFIQKNPDFIDKNDFNIFKNLYLLKHNNNIRTRISSPGIISGKENNNNTERLSNMSNNNLKDYPKCVQLFKIIKLSLTTENNITFSYFHKKFPMLNITEDYFNIFKETYLSKLRNNNVKKYNSFSNILKTNKLSIKNITFNNFSKKYPELNINKDEFNIYKNVYLLPKE